MDPTWKHRAVGKADDLDKHNYIDILGRSTYNCKHNIMLQYDMLKYTILYDNISNKSRYNNAACKQLQHT